MAQDGSLAALRAVREDQVAAEVLARVLVGAVLLELLLGEAHRFQQSAPLLRAARLAAEPYVKAAAWARPRRAQPLGVL